MPETRYAPCGDLSLAYQVFGSGPVDLVVCGAFVTNVEVMWGSPEYKGFFDLVGSFARVLTFDKAGIGLSDPVAKLRTIEERVDEIEAVMDAAGFVSAALLGFSEGGAAAMLLAATKPDRVQSLVLIGSTAISPIPSSRNWGRFRRCGPFRRSSGRSSRSSALSTPRVRRRLPAFSRAAAPSVTPWGTRRSVGSLRAVDQLASATGHARAGEREPGHGSSCDRRDIHARSPVDPPGNPSADPGHPRH